MARHAGQLFYGKHPLCRDLPPFMHRLRSNAELARERGEPSGLYDGCC